MNFINKKYFFLFVLLIFLTNLAECKSNDSPNLDVKIKNEITWNQWIKNIKVDLKKKNIQKRTLDYLDSLKFNSRVIELDRKQPEFRLTFDKYLRRVVTTENKVKLNSEFQKNKDLFLEIESQFKVNSKILAALWGIETSFGKHVGKLDILQSLASLAYDGRRKEFFNKELENALTILDRGHFDRKLFKGSWAGAFGQTQFMPSTFLKYAVDFDGDSKKNLFQKNDALASGANYLSKIGWKDSLYWGEKVDLVLNESFKKLAKNKEFKNVKFWKNNGIKLKKSYENNSLRLVLPDSNNNDCYLVSKNFDVILNWNRSNYFALTVFLFSDELN